MTFYWWSHWFWITLLCNLILPQIVVVHTYPSQQSIQEYNHNHENDSKNLITRLYRSTTVLSWTTESPIFTKSTTTTEETLIHQGTEEEIPAPSLSNNEAEDEYYYDEDTTEDNINQKINLEQVEAELENKEKHIISLNKDTSENDVKRSAEVITKANLDTKTDNKLSVTSATPPVIAEANNYTNFTEQTLALSTNTTTTTTLSTTRNTTSTTNNTNNASDSQKNNTPTTTTQIATAHETGIVNDTTTLLPQAPETPKIVKAQSGNLDWLNTVAAQLPPAHLTTDDGTHDYPEDDHKIPFTLENVSEHRSRKSKVLSADYKVNRYINYSTDSKNHLTRSTTEFEEPNISSERLSVQPTYFKDVGAISAICFTVFGICCTVGTVGIVLYRRRFLNKPQALSEPDSSVYIDDSTMRVSDNSDEMYSLDNDSFLNSLEAMTIQNYWTDTVKHTKL